MPDLDNRDALEQRVTGVMTRAFNQARKLLQEELWKEGLTTRDLANVSFSVLNEIRQRLLEQLQPILYEGYMQSARSFSNLMSYGIDENVLIQQALAWSQAYSLSLVDTLMSTTQNQLARTAQQADNLPVSRAGLRTLLLAIFSLNRVDTIARTEITNAISAGENFVQERMVGEGAKVEVVWFTQLDERVCFPKNTWVHTSQSKQKLITTIKVGDMVLTRHGLRPVTHIYNRQYTGQMVVIKTQSGSVHATANHLFYHRYTDEGDGNWVEAIDIMPNVELAHHGVWVKVTGIEVYNVENITVYDFTVSEHHEFYANGFLVHNCPICAPRHGKLQGDGWQNDPPAHPRCRCYKGYRITMNGNQVILFDDEAVARRLRTG